MSSGMDLCTGDWPSEPMDVISAGCGSADDGGVSRDEKTEGILFEMLQKRR